MTYSQAPLLSLLSTGKILGEVATPEHIETVISNVFLFKEYAYKLYKNDNEFFNKSYNDLSSKVTRLDFVHSDFEWNHQLSKEVYLRLQGVKVVENEIVFVNDFKDADELLQVTKRLPSNSVLFDLLNKDALAENDYREMGKQFALREKNFSWNETLPDEMVLDNMLSRYNDIVEWIESADKYIPKVERDEYMKQFRELIMREFGADFSKVSICFDVHSLNIFYVNGVLYPFDTYSPKAPWRVGPSLLNLYRIATDIFALVGESKFRAFVDGYHETLFIDAPTKDTEHFFIIYSALIMIPYFYILGQKEHSKMEIALKYHNFLKQQI